MRAAPAAAEPLRICVAYPEPDSFSETFIRAHVERLPATVVLTGGSFPTRRLDRGRLWFYPLALARNAVTQLPRRFDLPLRVASDVALARLLRANRIDVVLAEYGQTGVSLAAACRRAGVPLVVHFHGNDAYSAPVLAQYAEGYRELFAQARAVIAVSHDMLEQLRSLGADPERLHYNPCGVDLGLFREAEPAASPPVFVAAGRFVDKKAPDLTLLAFAQVALRHPEARLVMIGTGPLREACERLARGLGLEDRVEFPGVLAHAEVAVRMRGARALVQHSLRSEDGDREGTPVAVLEAAAAGLPVIATRHGGIPDVVADGETGILVDEGDVEAMAAAIAALVESPARAASLGHAGRLRAARDFDMERSIATLAGLLRSATG